MPTKSVEEILHRAMSDRAFTELLFANPEKALAGYNLSAEDLATFKGISRAEFAGLAIEERKSMASGGSYEPPSGRNHNQSALDVK
jgi:hypothetical protein